MLIKFIVKSIIKSIDFMIPILSDTFDTVYGPTLHQCMGRQTRSEMPI